LFKETIKSPGLWEDGKKVF